MATSDMGLFGPTPYEIQQAQQQSLQQNAAAYANQSPLQRAAQGMYQAGGMLGGMAASGLGMVNPQVEQAKRTEQVMSSGDTDIGTSAGLLAKADEFRKAGDLRMAATLTMKGKEMQKQEAAAALAARKQDFQEKEVMDFKREQLMQQTEQKKAQLEQQAEAARLRSEDSRYSAQQRAEAAKYAADARREISMLMAQVRQMGIEAKGTASAKGNDTGAKINVNSMKDADKWRIIKEQGADKAAIGSASAQSADVVSLATSLLSHPGLESITGYDSWTNWAALPNSPAKGALTLLDSLKSKAATVGRALASESGKLGNMAMGEWKIVSDDIANLDPASPDFSNQVRRIVKKTEDMESRLRQNYDDTYSVYEGLNPSLSAATLPPQPPPANLGGKGVTPTPKPAVNDFDAKWSALKSGQSLVGPDGKTYTKK